MGVVLGICIPSWIPAPFSVLTLDKGAGVNQQPPVHQFRMKPFKPFWGWTKNTSSCPTQGFFSTLLCPKNFPYYLRPTSLISFPALSISRAHENSQAWVAKSFKETWNTRLEEGGELNIEGMWRGEGKRSASFQMRSKRRKVRSLPSLHFISSIWFFSLCFFFFSSTW
jgi:hypothetical protein